jgi:uncharacterized membrane protein YeaQ/YmgE (transglycosylase-associated protein family)
VVLALGEVPWICDASASCARRQHAHRPSNVTHAVDGGDAATPAAGRSIHVGILAWILVGLIGGVIAKLIVPGDDPGGASPMGIVITILLGIAGALLGGFLAVAMGISDGVNNFDWGTILLSIVGAVIILFGYKALAGRGGLRV